MPARRGGYVVGAMSTDIEPLEGRHRAAVAPRTSPTPALVLATAGAVTVLLIALLLALQLRQGGL